jgi:hypothetical protein
MNQGGDGPSPGQARVTDGLVAVERETERREAGVVTTYRVTTENDRPVAVRVVNELPDESSDGAGFHPAREPRWWAVEDDRLQFKDTVGRSGPATFEFGLAMEGGYDDGVSFPAPEIAHSEPVGVAPEGDRVVFPDADGDADDDGVSGPAAPAGDEERQGGLLSGVRSAVFGGDDEDVVRASDLDPDAMVVSREREAVEESATTPTQPHHENPTLSPVVVPTAVSEGEATFSALRDEAATDADDSPTETDDSATDGTEASSDATEVSDEPDERPDEEAEDSVLEALLAELDDEDSRARLREELGLAELHRTREAVDELREEVRNLRADLEATADASETTAARVSELCQAVDSLSEDLDRNVTVQQPGVDTGADG